MGISGIDNVSAQHFDDPTPEFDTQAPPPWAQDFGGAGPAQNDWHAHAHGDGGQMAPPPGQGGPHMPGMMMQPNGDGRGQAPIDSKPGPDAGNSAVRNLPEGSAKTLMTALLPELHTQLNSPEQVQTLIDGFNNLAAATGDKNTAAADIASNLPAPTLTAITNAMNKSGIQVDNLSTEDMKNIASALATLKDNRGPEPGIGMNHDVRGPGFGMNHDARGPGIGMNHDARGPGIGMNHDARGPASA